MADPMTPVQLCRKCYAWFYALPYPADKEIARNLHPTASRIVLLHRQRLVQPTLSAANCLESILAYLVNRSTATNGHEEEGTVTSRSS